MTLPSASQSVSEPEQAAPCPHSQLGGLLAGNHLPRIPTNVLPWQLPLGHSWVPETDLMV